MKVNLIEVPPNKNSNGEVRLLIQDDEGNKVMFKCHTDVYTHLNAIKVANKIKEKLNKRDE